MPQSCATGMGRIPPVCHSTDDNVAALSRVRAGSGISPGMVHVAVLRHPKHTRGERTRCICYAERTSYALAVLRCAFAGAYRDHFLRESDGDHPEGARVGFVGMTNQQKEELYKVKEKRLCLGHSWRRAVTSASAKRPHAHLLRQRG